MTPASRRKLRAALNGYGFLSFSIVGFLVFSLIPVIASFVLSFYKFDNINPPRFLGLGNYISLLGWHADPSGETVMNHPVFWRAMGNTAFLMLGLPITVFGSLLLAMALNRKLPLTKTLRTIFYLPSVTPMIGVALIWFWVLNPEYGLLNNALRFVGIEGPNWLGDTTWAKPAFILITTWMTVGGFNMLLYLAALQGIPRDQYEAAEIDGAGAWRQFWSITWPLLGPVNFFVIVMSVIAGLQAFSMQYVMTTGGPAGSTTTIAYYIFDNAFSYLKMGYACAAAWVLFFITFLLTLLQWKFRSAYAYQYD